MLVQLNNTWIESDHVIAVRESPLDEDQTCVWCIGQSATDGAFLIDLPIDDVIERLQAIAQHALAVRLLEEVESDTIANDGSASLSTTASLRD